MIFDWIKNYALGLTAVALAVAVGAAGLQSVRLANSKSDFAQYKVEVTQLEAVRERIYSTELKASQDATSALQSTINTHQRRQDAQIALINTRHAAAVASLRNRPESRTTSVSSTTIPAAAAEGATGLQLSGPDGRFLAGEAARADALRSALQICYQNYDAARDGLQAYSKEISK